MKKLLIAIAIVLLILLPVNALSEKIVFCTSEWEPYMMMEDGEITGLDVEIIRELCNRLGFESEIQVFPFKRALKSVERGTADAIFAVRQTEERAAFLYYPSESINIERTVILARKGSGIKINRLDDLKGKNVGVVNGYAYDPKFNDYQGIYKIGCNDDKQLVKIFAHQRIPLVVGADEGSIKYLCKQAGVEAEVVYVLNEMPSYIAFSKAIGERGKILTEKFSDALRQLKQEDFIKKIESKYF